MSLSKLMVLFAAVSALGLAAAARADLPLAGSMKSIDGADVDRQLGHARPQGELGEHGGDRKDRVADDQGEHLHPEDFIDQSAGPGDQQKSQDIRPGPANRETGVVGSFFHPSRITPSF